MNSSPDLTVDAPPEKNGKMNIYLVEATVGGDQDLFRYYTEDEKLFSWFVKGDVEGTPQIVLEQLLANKEEIGGGFCLSDDGFRIGLENAKTAQEVELVLDEWLDRYVKSIGGVRPYSEIVNLNVAMRKQRLLEDGLVALGEYDNDDGEELKGAFEDIPAYTSRDFLKWSRENNVNVLDVLEVVTV